MSRFALLFVFVFYFQGVHGDDPITAGLQLSPMAIGMLVSSPLAGVWAEKFDHMAAITNFVVTPAAFLSGAFYSASRLPEFWQQVAHANPLFYMIDGFRYGFIGHADGSLAAGLLVMAGFNLFLVALTWRLFATGYHLKA